MERSWLGCPFVIATHFYFNVLTAYDIVRLLEDNRQEIRQYGEYLDILLKLRNLICLGSHVQYLEGTEYR